MKQPRRKRKRWQREPPLPIPIASLTGEPVGPRSWFYYCGVLQGATVVISHSGDISFLYSMGFFGKGNLSRSKPDFSQRSFTGTVERPGDKRFITAKVISRRSYVRHLKNSKSHVEDLPELCDCDGDDNDENDEDIEDFHPWQPWASATAATAATTATTATTEAAAGESAEMLDQEACMESTVEESRNLQCVAPQQVFSKTGKTVSDSRSTGKNSWDDNMAGDADFWGTEEAKDSASKNRPDSSGTGDQQEALQIPVACGGAAAQSSRSAGCDGSSHVDSGLKPLSENDACFESCNPGLSVKMEKSRGEKRDMAEEEMEGTRDVISAKGVGKSCTSHEPCSDLNSLGENQMEVDSVTEHSVSVENSTHDHAPSSHDTHLSFIPNVPHSVSSAPENSTQLQRGSAAESARIPCKPHVMSPAKAASASSSKADAAPRLRSLHACADVDPLCQWEDEDGDVLVVADSDGEVQKQKQCVRHARRWLPVLKKDPWPASEELCLMLEEAFFLSYGLGCLSVTRQGEETALGLEELWGECCRLQDKFAARYVVYQHLRSKGWVPKAGLKFACDFVLYEEGPLATHSSYCVLVRQVGEDRLGVEVDTITDLQCLDPALLAGANRMTNTVSKELLFCHVVVPSGMEEEMLKSPKCISQLSVMETALTRWVPSQERVEKSSSN